MFQVVRLKKPFKVGNDLFNQDELVGQDFLLYHLVRALPMSGMRTNSFRTLGCISSLLQIQLFTQLRSFSNLGHQIHSKYRNGSHRNT